MIVSQQDMIGVAVVQVQCVEGASGLGEAAHAALDRGGVKGAGEQQHALSVLLSTR